MFVKHGGQGQSSLILAEVVNDFLLSGIGDEYNKFNTFIWDDSQLIDFIQK